MTTKISVADFFAWRFDGLGSEETIEIRSFLLGGGAPRQSWHATPLEAAQAALSRPDEHEVFYGVNARQRGGGKAEHVTLLRGLWADQDYKHSPDGAAGAARALAAFPLQPTAVIESGGGNHLYWQFAEAVAPSPAIEALLLRLYAALVPGDGKLDSVQDPSRILRVPGTLNHKTNPARLVTIRDEDPARRYAPADFALFLPEPVEQPRPVWSPPSGGSPRPAFDSVPPFEELREILRHIPAGGDYTTDWLRILAAVHSVYPGSDGIALCEGWCPGKPGEVARKFASFKRDGRADNATSLGTLIHLAKQHGYQPPRPMAATFVFVDANAEPSAVPLDQVRAAVFALQQENEELRRDGERMARLLAFCKDEHKRKDARIEAQETEIAAYKAAAAHTDATIGGAIFDIATEVVAAHQRGDVLVEDGRQKVRVSYKRAALKGVRSAQTNSKAVHKIHDSGHVSVAFRPFRVESENYSGEVEAAYIEIPTEHCETPAKAALYLLPPPGPKKQGGVRRRITLPAFDEVVEGPVKCVTEKRKLWSSVATERVVKVEAIDSHTEYFSDQGEQMTVDEVRDYQEHIGLKARVAVPSYRPPVQQTLTEVDRELVRPPMGQADFDAWLDEEPTPIPLHGPRCRAQGCGGRPSSSGYCERHDSLLAMATGAD
jgi:hypothetical protein